MNAKMNILRELLKGVEIVKTLQRFVKARVLCQYYITTLYARSSMEYLNKTCVSVFP